MEGYEYHLIPIEQSSIEKLRGAITDVPKLSTTGRATYIFLVSICIATAIADFYHLLLTYTEVIFQLEVCQSYILCIPILLHRSMMSSQAS